MLRTGFAMFRRAFWVPIALVAIPFSLVSLASSSLRAADPKSNRELLTPAQWKRLDASVDSGLKFLATQQRANGSFQTLDLGQPGITSLCILAYLSRGHLPHEGQYGVLLDKAIDYVLSTQKDNGLLFDLPFNGQEYGDRRHKTGAYNHAIAGVTLAEVYGMTQGEQRESIGRAIENAIKYSLTLQKRQKPNPDENGGWRYLTYTSNGDSDLSVTAWEIMFFRAARNAGFEIPVESIDEAMNYVRRVYVPKNGTFAYGVGSMRNQQTRAMAGSGILLLSLGGEHDTEMARKTGKWILNHRFDVYQRVVFGAEHYHYGAYYCSQAMFQLGGDDWHRFYPAFMDVHIGGQQPNGAWPKETNRDGDYGSVFTTSLMILSLTPPYQLLPIYQR